MMMTRWMPIPNDEGNFYCTVHDDRAADCDCPELVNGDRRPYVPTFQLIQWKHAIRVEAKGLRFKGGSVKAHAARRCGLGSRAKREAVLGRIEEELAMRERAMGETIQ